MTPTTVQFYPDAPRSLIALTETLLISVAARTKKPFYLALSGGETVQTLLEVWSTLYNDPTRWKNVHFFWVDECYTPTDNEICNYRYAEELFFKPVGINPNRIYRISSKEEPATEAERYARLIAEMLPTPNNVPTFDCTIVEISEDEHIGALFTNRLDLLKADDLYTVVQHPVTEQLHITQTGELLLASREILITLAGDRKKELLHRLVNCKSPMITPATYILSHTPRATIFTEISLNSKELSL